MVARCNEEIKRRTRRIFPKAASCRRLIRALAVETHEQWLEANSYVDMDLLKEQRQLTLSLAACRGGHDPKAVAARPGGRQPLTLNVPPLPAKEAKLYYPGGAVDYIEANGLAGNLLVSLNWGEYGFWRLYPQVLVAPDGRYETAYAAQVLAETFAIEDAQPGWAQLLRAYAPDLVLVNTRSRLYPELLKQREWQVLYRDARAAWFGQAAEFGKGSVSEKQPKREGNGDC